MQEEIKNKNITSPPQPPSRNPHQRSSERIKAMREQNSISPEVTPAIPPERISERIKAQQQKKTFNVHGGKKLEVYFNNGK